MAQQGPDSQNVNAQSNDKLDNENPQLLNSEMAKVSKNPVLMPALQSSVPADCNIICGQKAFQELAQ